MAIAKPEPIPADTAPPVQHHTATPDNTPIPGGGSWKWDATLLGWVSNDAPATTPPQGA